MRHQSFFLGLSAFCLSLAYSEINVPTNSSAEDIDKFFSANEYIPTPEEKKCLANSNGVTAYVLSCLNEETDTVYYKILEKAKQLHKEDQYNERWLQKQIGKSYRQCLYKTKFKMSMSVDNANCLVDKLFNLGKNLK